MSPKSIKIFRSRWELNASRIKQNKIWDDIESELTVRGYKVLDKEQDCDLALLLNGFFINPSAFKKRIFFYSSDDTETNKLIMNEAFIPIAKEYGEVVDLGFMTPMEAVDKILEWNPTKGIT